MLTEVNTRRGRRTKLPSPQGHSRSLPTLIGVSRASLIQEFFEKSP